MGQLDRRFSGPASARCGVERFQELRTAGAVIPFEEAVELGLRVRAVAEP
jgi:hypothetical protein